MNKKKELVKMLTESLLNDSTEWGFNNHSDGSFYKLNNETTKLTLKFNSDLFSYGWKLTGMHVRDKPELPEIKLGIIRYNKLWRIIKKMKIESDGDNSEAYINSYLLRISKMEEL